MLNDVTMDIVYKAMQGLSARQKATADNIANVETPGFRASTVDFESSLRSAIQDGDATEADFATAKSAQPNRPNDNNVHLDDETVTATNTNPRYLTMLEPMTAKFR